MLPLLSEENLSFDFEHVAFLKTTTDSGSNLRDASNSIARNTEHADGLYSDELCPCKVLLN